MHLCNDCSRLEQSVLKSWLDYSGVREIGASGADKPVPGSFYGNPGAIFFALSQDPSPIMHMANGASATAAGENDNRFPVK